MRTPIRLTLLLAVAGLTLGLSACGGGEPADDRDGSGSSSEESPAGAGDLAALEGGWQHTGDTPSAVSSLIIEADGKAKFAAEGDTETFAGTVADYGARDGAFADAFKLHMTAVDQDGDPVEGRYLDLILRLENDGRLLRVTFGEADDGDTKDFRPLEE